MDNVKYGPQDGHCGFNKMVDCNVLSCTCCGWNPEVAADRVEDWHMERRLAGKK